MPIGSPARKRHVTLPMQPPGFGSRSPSVSRPPLPLDSEAPPFLPQGRCQSRTQPDPAIQLGRNSLLRYSEPPPGFGHRQRPKLLDRDLEQVGQPSPPGVVVRPVEDACLNAAAHLAERSNPPRALHEGAAVKQDPSCCPGPPT